MDNQNTPHRTFSTEYELTFTVPKKLFKRLLEHLIPIRSEHLAQKWFLKTESNNGEVITQHRIRKTERREVQTITYSYDTKYRFSASERLEFNAPITAEEFNTISEIHSDSLLVKKTRIITQDRETGLTYYIDIYTDEPDKDLKVEIEFKAKEEMSGYKVPKWLKENMIKNSDK